MLVSIHFTSTSLVAATSTAQIRTVLLLLPVALLTLPVHVLLCIQRKQNNDTNTTTIHFCLQRDRLSFYFYFYSSPKRQKKMKFRPCIDLHNGQVKQIVGSTLTDDTDQYEDRRSSNDHQQDGGDNCSKTTNTNIHLQTNFVTTKPASEYAIMYAEDQLTGGHVIMLGPGNVEAAKDAIQIATKYNYPNECKLQIGGGITSTNAKEWIDYGASHVIITSYFFENGQIRYDRLNELMNSIGKDKLVLDLSCRKNQNQIKWNNKNKETKQQQSQLIPMTTITTYIMS
jgi:phosphoribosylformimino-5-aminoimidazole carboxamide ribonucleotide (ProFAR) isomerase